MRPATSCSDDGRLSGGVPEAAWQAEQISHALAKPNMATVSYQDFAAGSCSCSVLCNHDSTARTSQRALLIWLCSDDMRVCGQDVDTVASACCERPGQLGHSSSHLTSARSARLLCAGDAIFWYARDSASHALPTCGWVVPISRSSASTCASIFARVSSLASLLTAHVAVSHHNRSRGAYYAVTDALLSTAVQKLAAMTRTAPRGIEFDGVLSSPPSSSYARDAARRLSQHQPWSLTSESMNSAARKHEPTDEKTRKWWCSTDLLRRSRS